MRASNACSTYAGAVHPKDAFGLVDILISGNGKKELLFTEYYIYYNNGIWGSQREVSYKEVNESGTIPSALFDAVCPDELDAAAIISLPICLMDGCGEEILAVSNGEKSAEEAYEDIANTDSGSVNVGFLKDV